jgi:hypothetical protein
MSLRNRRECSSKTASKCTLLAAGVIMGLAAFGAEPSPEDDRSRRIREDYKEALGAADVAEPAKSHESQLERHRKERADGNAYAAQIREQYDRSKGVTPEFEPEICDGHPVGTPARADCLAEVERLTAAIIAGRRDTNFATMTRVNKEVNDFYARTPGTQQYKTAQLIRKEQAAIETAKAKCGKDYQRISVGMSFKRVKECMGRAFQKRSEQLMPDGTVLKSYQTRGGYVHVLGDKVVRVDSF